MLAQRLGGVAQGGQHSSAGSGNYRLPIVTSRVRVHAKVLTAPAVPLTTLFQNMREVYATVNIDVEWATEEALAAGVRYLPDEQADNVLLTLVDDAVAAVRKEALKAVSTDPSQELADKVEVLQEYGSVQAVRELAAEVFDRTSGQGGAPTP